MILAGQEVKKSGRQNSKWLQYTLWSWILACILPEGPRTCSTVGEQASGDADSEMEVFRQEVHWGKMRKQNLAERIEQRCCHCEGLSQPTGSSETAITLTGLSCSEDRRPVLLTEGFCIYWLVATGCQGQGVTLPERVSVGSYQP